MARENSDIQKLHYDLVQGQNKSGEYIQRLTYVSMMFLPLMVVSSVFSMAPSVLPFAQNFPAFSCTLAVVATLMLVLANFPDRIGLRLQGALRTGSEAWDEVRLSGSAVKLQLQQRREEEGLPI